MVKKYKMVLVLLLLCCVRFFYGGGAVFGIHYLDIICLAVLGWCVCGLMASNMKVKSLSGESKSFSWPVLAFLILILIEMVYSYALYRQPFATLLKVTYYYFIPVVYFVLMVIIDTPEKNEWFKYSIVVISVVGNVIWILKGCYHFYILIISFPIIFAYILKNTHRWLVLMHLLTTAVCFFFITDNAALRLVFFGVLFVEFIASKVSDIRNENNRKVVKWVILICIGVVLASGVVGSYIQTFLEDDVGSQIRTHAMEYYWEQFKEKPLLGMGIYDDTADPTLYKLMHGAMSPLGGMSQYYIEDVGIVGYINQFGIVGLLIMTSIVWKMYICIQSSANIEKLQNIGILTTMSIMFISLMPTNKAVIHVLPIMLVIVERNAMLYNKYNQDAEEKCS